MMCAIKFVAKVFASLVVLYSLYVIGYEAYVIHHDFPILVDKVLGLEAQMNPVSL